MQQNVGDQDDTSSNDNHSITHYESNEDVVQSREQNYDSLRPEEEEEQNV